MKNSLFMITIAGLTSMVLSHTSPNVFSVESSFKLQQGICMQSCCQKLKSRPAQSYIYYQDTGHFVGGSGQYAVDTYAYSGLGDGYNNPSMTCTEYGPLPPTKYRLAECVNQMHNPPVDYPCAFVLEPLDESKMCGQSGYLIHGCKACTEVDKQEPPSYNRCSGGCIVMGLSKRKLLRIGDSLQVVKYEKKHAHHNDSINLE